MLLTKKTYQLKNIQTIILILLGILYLYFGIPSLNKRILTWSDGYALGDWIITYEDGGFKRRGLSGYIFIFLARTTNIYVGSIILFFLIFIYTTFILTIIYWLRKIKFNYFLLIFFLLPTTLFFSINDFYVFGRKEILLFLLTILFLISYKKNKNIHSWMYIFFLSLSLAILTLLHELVVFFISYILIIYLYDYYYKKRGNLFKIFIVFSSAFLPALCIFIFGKEINEGHSWDIFKKLNVGSNVMNGIFSWPKEGFGSGKVNALKFAKIHNYENYIISFLITTISYIIVLYKEKFTIKNISIIMFLFLLALLFSSPIFFLTIDWGRWLNIHFMMLLMLTSTFLKTNKDHYISLNDLFINLKKPVFYLKLISLFIIMFYFSMEHVENGFIIGQNHFLLNIRDLIWQIRHFHFYN